MRILCGVLTMAVAAASTSAKLKQTGLWHMFAGTYDYYLWNAKGAMVFVKGGAADISLSAFLSPDNQWVYTVPETAGAVTSVVYVADDFTHVLIHTKKGNLHELHAYAMNTSLKLLGSVALGTETGEQGPPYITWAGRNLFVARRLTAAGQVEVALVTPTLQWKMKTQVQTWGGWSAKAAPVYSSPHGKYFAVETSYDVPQQEGIVTVYKSGKNPVNMGETNFASAVRWVNSAQDKTMEFCIDNDPPSVWRAMQIGSLHTIATMSLALYTTWQISSAGKGSVVLLSPAKTLTVQTEAKTIGPFAVPDLHALDFLNLMYFDGQKVVLTVTGLSGVNLRTYRVSTQELTLIAGPESCGIVMYTTRGKGFFAFSDMLGQLKVFTPTLKLLGQTSGGPPLFKGRAALLMDFLSAPRAFAIYRW
jgi:hypothetical protein